MSTVTTDPAYAAAVAILTGSPPLHERVADCIHHDWIDWPAIDKVRLSDGERILVTVAEQLWAGNGTGDLGDAVVHLDDANWALVIDALQIRRPVRVGAGA